MIIARSSTKLRVIGCSVSTDISVQILNSSHQTLYIQLLHSVTTNFVLLSNFRVSIANN